jgi:3-deoxy-D-manno-octulosonate 8-phosphate phosphatase (KDO 8-P phosphatase)
VVITFVLSGGSNEGVRVRLRNLGITDIHLGSANKVETFDEYTDVYNIKPEQVLYMETISRITM